MNEQPFTSFTPPEPERKPPTGMAVASLVLGIIALTLPIPVVDVIAGVIGLVLAVAAKKQGARGMATAGLVLSIIGTIAAIQFTAQVFGLFPTPQLPWMPWGY